MPKIKFTLSKKHEYLIDKLVEIPTTYDIQHPLYDEGIAVGSCMDFRYNTEDLLLQIIERLTKGTQMEEVGKDISSKAREVFDYYSDNY